MRVCICISGQLRATDESIAFLRRFVAGSDVTLVFSLWDKIGRKLDGALNVDQLPRMFERDAYLCIPRSRHGFLHLWAFLPELRRRLDPSLLPPQADRVAALVAEAFPDALLDIESSDTLDLTFDSRVEDGNSKKMTYKIWRANEIKRKLERTHGTFDVVIRLRPDLILEHIKLQEIVDTVAQGTVLVSGWNTERVWIDDVFAAGSSEAMDVYSSIFARAIALPQTWTLVHKDLHRLIGSLGVDVQNLRVPQRFASDPLITLDELHDSLEAMRGEPTVWSAAHEVALSAASALRVKRASGARAALEVLKERSSSLVAAGADASDPFLVTACDCLGEIGEVRPAGLCALALARWHREPWEAFRVVAAGAFGKVVGVYLDAESGPLRDIPDWLMADSSQAWLLDWLREVVAPTDLRSWLVQKFAVVLEDPQTIRELVNLLIQRNESDRLGEIITLADVPSDEGDDVVAQRRDSLAKAYEALGQGDRSLQESRRAVTLAPKNIELLYQLAHKLKRAGLYLEARDAQARAVAAAPSHGGANRQLAEICLCLGDTQLALKHAQAALAIEPSARHTALVAFASAAAGNQIDDEAFDRAVVEMASDADFMKIPGFADFLRDRLARHKMAG